jgi:drug/metabolite transporter (DMT)-like permease
MDSIIKSIIIGVFVGVVGTIFLNIFSDYVSEDKQALVFAIFSGLAFIVTDIISKKRKSKRAIDS